jgi:hypothetical protein
MVSLNPLKPFRHCADDNYDGQLSKNTGKAV